MAYKRYIDACELAEVIESLDVRVAGKSARWYDAKHSVLREIAQAPDADVVEVVRCNKCSHCEIVIDQFDNDWYFCKKTANNAEVKPNDFCSYGKRRTDDDV